MKMLKCCLQTISSLVHFLGNEKRYRGYIKDKDDKKQWIIDEKAAEVIRRIFHLTMDGKGPYAIARILEADKIDIPAYHQQKLGYGLHQSKVFEYPYRWCSSTIASILKKQEYIGYTVNFKTRKHFKDKKSKYVSEDNEAFFHSIQNEMEESEKMEMEKKRTRLTDSKKRLQELERLMYRIYEDMILEKIPNNRYEILNNQYETEQRELSKENDGLEKAIKRYEKETDRAKKFIRLIERYDNFDELTPTIINEFVEKILVHKRDRKGSQTANQKVEIYFNFIGNYEPPKEELSEEERQKLREDEEKERERKDSFHQNYLKRKENGKQKEYEERYKVRREEKKQEKIKVLKRVGIPVKDLDDNL